MFVCATEQSHHQGFSPTGVPGICCASDSPLQGARSQSERRPQTAHAPYQRHERRLRRGFSTYLIPDVISNMAVIEVNLVSGFNPDKDNLKMVMSRNPRAIEVEDAKTETVVA